MHQTDLDDPGQRNDPRRRAVTRADLLSKLSGLPAGLCADRRLHRLQLHLAVSVSGNGIWPCSSMLDQSILRACR